MTRALLLAITRVCVVFPFALPALAGQADRTGSDPADERIARLRALAEAQHQRVAELEAQVAARHAEAEDVARWSSCGSRSASSSASSNSVRA